MVMEYDGSAKVPGYRVAIEGYLDIGRRVEGDSTTCITMFEGVGR